jgi:hypothetical protein
MEKMLPIEPLLESIKEVCKSKGIDFGTFKRRLEHLVGSDTVVGYYMSEGPFPVREDVLLDVFVLSPICLYNLDVRIERKSKIMILCHRLFLDQISLIEERPEYSKDGESYLACVIFTAMHDLVLREREPNQDDAEKFLAQIKDAVIAIKKDKR